MGRTDAVTKAYMSKPQYFADAFNSSIFHGRQVVKAGSLSLQEMDPTELGIIITEDTKEIAQKVRDILKKSVVMHDEKMFYLLLGIENQTEIHYAMPVRNLLYDALNYGQQVNEIAAMHKKKKDVTGAEFLSGFSKTDKIMPVITLTVYFGSEEWDAPRSLKEMFLDGIDEDILAEVDDYRLHLIVPAEIQDFSLFQTDFGKAMKYIAVSTSAEKIKEISKDAAFAKVEADTVRLINECTGSNITVQEGEVYVNMCKGLEELRAEGIAEGRAEGIAEGTLKTLVALVQKGLLTMKDAAEQAGMTVGELQQQMQKR